MGNFTNYYLFSHRVFISYSTLNIREWASSYKRLDTITNYLPKDVANIYFF